MAKQKPKAISAAVEGAASKAGGTSKTKAKKGQKRKVAATPAQKSVLHVGCGAFDPLNLNRIFRTKDWVETRLDIDPAVKPDIVASISDLTKIRAGSFDAIWSSHNLEHLEAHEVQPAVKGFHRVIKKSGFFLVTVPDLEAVAMLIMNGGIDQRVGGNADGTVAITPLDMLYGWGHYIAQGNSYMAHRTGFTPKRLGENLVEAGFDNVRVTRGPSHTIWALAGKGEVPPPASLLHQAIKNSGR